jgi:hypothetical protein
MVAIYASYLSFPSHCEFNCWQSNYSLYVQARAAPNRRDFFMAPLRIISIAGSMDSCRWQVGQTLPHHGGGAVDVGQESVEGHTEGWDLPIPLPVVPDRRRGCPGAGVL